MIQKQYYILLTVGYQLPEIISPILPHMLYHHTVHSNIVFPAYQSYLKLSNPDSQCQFNRTGLLCGKCQQGLSTVFGTPQCKHCSNVYLLLIIPIVIGSVAFVVLLYIFDITIRYGTVNTCIFYINVLDINILLLFPNCKSFICVALSYMNLEFRTNHVSTMVWMIMQRHGWICLFHCFS